MRDITTIRSQSEQEQVRAELAYSETYRFRLWIAVLEESSALGMGFRAFRSHVRRSLKLWSDAGTVFLSFKGGALNLDALTDDDLWGFLGKKDERPQGPKRHIQAQKLAVLDVFFKKQYPALARLFGAEQISNELTANLAMFFTAANQTSNEAKRLAAFEAIEGVYVQKLVQIEPPDKHNAFLDPRYQFIVAVFMFSLDKSSGRCAAHKIELPLRSSFITPEGSHWRSDEFMSHLERFSISETVVYSGIALISKPRFNQAIMQLSCILRDRTTYDPHLAMFVVSGDANIPGRRSGMEWATGGWHIAYDYCGKKLSDMIENEERPGHYTKEMFREIFEFYSRLGLEM